MGRNDLSRPVQVRCYSPPGSKPYPPNTIAFIYGRVAVSKEDSKTILIEAINILPFGGDPNTDDYDLNIPDMLPQLIAVGHVTAKAAPIGPSGALRGFPLNTAEYVRDAVVHSTIHCAFDMSQVRWAHAPAPFPNTCVQVSGTFAYNATDTGCLGIVIDHITLNLSASSNAAGNGNGGDNDNEEGGSPSKKRKFRSTKPQTTASNATTRPAPSSANDTEMELCPPTPPHHQPPPPPLTPFPNRTQATLSSFPRVSVSYSSRVSSDGSPPTPSPSPLATRQQGTPAYPSLPGLPIAGAQRRSSSAIDLSQFALPPPPAPGIRDEQSPSTSVAQPVPQADTATQGPRARGRRRNPNAADSGPAGPSTPRPSLHPPVAQVTTEATTLPPLASFGFPGMSQAISIREPTSNLSARQRSKQTDNYINPDLL